MEENIEVDMQKYERERRNEMLKDKHLRLEIVIPENPEEHGDSVGFIPSINRQMCGCSGKAISLLYVTLNSVLEDLREEFPIECLAGEFLFGVHPSTEVHKDYKNREEMEKDIDE